MQGRRPSGTIKLSSFAITSNPEEADNGQHYPDEINQILVKTQKLVGKKKPRVIPDLLKLIEKYPHIPAFKNYLSSYYRLLGKPEKSYEVNHWTLKEHPDYLFGKLNLAVEYMEKQQPEKVLEILGESLGLQELYPERKVFFVQEYISFYTVSCRYLIQSDELEAAESRISMMEQVLNEHPIIEELRSLIAGKRLNNFIDRLDEMLEERGEEELGESGYDESVQTDTPPTFHHQEIWALYENDLNIDHAVLRKILALPRETLIADLERVLNDSIRRYDFFRSLIDEAEEWDEAKMSFPIHSLFMLSELKATEKLPFILDYFRQGWDFLEFWFTDHALETFWHFIYRLGSNQLGLLQEFMQEPYIHYYTRTNISKAVSQVAFHHPERKPEVLDWYSELLDFLLLNQDDPKILSPEFNGFLVADLIDLQAIGLLPAVKALYELDLVDPEIPGDYPEVEREMKDKLSSFVHKLELFPDIFEHYSYIATKWYGEFTDAERLELEAKIKENEKKIEALKMELEKKQKEFKQKEIQKAHLYSKIFSPQNGSLQPKVGRNESCPCGSGKKYKHCCGKS